jgi:hypothetical protein
MPVKRKRSTLEKAEAAAALVSPEPESPVDASFDSSLDDNNTGAGALTNAAGTLAISECPYTVEFRSSRGNRQKRSKTTKRNKVATTDGGPPPHQDLDKTPPEDNTTVFVVRPDKQWQQLKKYRNFVGLFPLATPLPLLC